MNRETGYGLGELDRRAGNFLRYGTVAEVDLAAARVKVRMGEITTGWVPWLTPRAGEDRFWLPPDVGEQVALVSPGDPSMGVAIGSLFSTGHAANGSEAKDKRITFVDGTLIEFDREASVLNVQVKSTGRIRLNVGQTTLLLEDGKATLTTPAIEFDAEQSTFTGAVTIQGDLQVDGDTALGDVTSNGVSINDTHKHSGVQGGPGTSGPVVP